MKTLNLNELSQVAGGTFEQEMAMAKTPDSTADSSSSSSSSSNGKPITTIGTRG